MTDAQFQYIERLTGPTTPYTLISAASTNATVIKGSSTTLLGVQVGNNVSTVRFLKFYNKATAPTVGTDTPVATFIIPGGTAGAGSNIAIPLGGLLFPLGLTFALTTGMALADTGAVGAADICLNIQYI